MLRDIFPSLLDGTPAPAAENIWEISRFAISERCSQGGFGFSEIPASILSEMIRFAGGHRIDALVGVTSTAVERMLKRMGLQVARLGHPQRIGEVMSLAFSIPIDARNLGVANATLVTKPHIELSCAA